MGLSNILRYTRPARNSEVLSNVLLLSYNMVSGTQGLAH